MNESCENREIQGLWKSCYENGLYPKAKDVYDLYFIVKYYRNGIDGLVKLFEDYKDSNIILDMKEKLSDKFYFPDYAETTDVAGYMDLRIGNRFH